MSKILILANHYNTLRIFRKELIKKLVADNHEVVISIPKTDITNINILKSYGCKIIITNFDRRGMNPIKDLFLLLKYFKLINKEKPDKVISYTIKPNIYGSIVCRIRGIKHYINITGLGSTFQSENFTRKLVSLMYKISLKKANKVFFENVGNRDLFIKDNIIKPEQSDVLAGAGVNIDEFEFTEYPDEGEQIKFLFVGRIMREKGVEELFEVIKRIKPEYTNVEFQFIGWHEDNYVDTVKNMERDNLISYMSFQPDVKPFIKNAHCIVLPSYHEGMSNTLLEGAAMGRPLITSNIHGCLEAVIDGKSGYLVCVGDERDLYDKILKFIELPYEDKVKMGKVSREHIVDRFDKNKVVQFTLKGLGL